MDFEKELKRLADRYRSRGFLVSIRPKPEELPAFAKDFMVELLAKRGADNVLVSVKKNRQALEDAKELPRYAEIINAQPGWKYDFAILEEENPLARELRGAREPSASELTNTLNDVVKVLEAGHVNVALVAAWGAADAAMRKRLVADGKNANWGTQPRWMLNELYSSGVLFDEDFHLLESVWRHRNEIVHGFQPAPIDAECVEYLIRTAKRLLEESQSMKQPA